MKLMSEERRNVIDYYRYWETDAIKADLDTRRHDFSILMSNESKDFNIGAVLRSSNAFLGRQLFVLGRRRFDRRGALGTYIYEHVVHVQSLDELPDQPIVAVDDVEGALPVESFEWPRGPFIMAFGHETEGVSTEVLERAASVVYIRQYGSVRSLNVGTAAGIAMYDYCRKLGETDAG
jgi:tRNA G18 (ribose-2'-O)-methylase SpoU